MTSTRTRAYDSPLRRAKAAANRAAILDAARESLASRGWAGTSMREIARAAGVSVETVYAVVGGKAELLKVLIDVAVVGDDEPAPLAERSVWETLGRGSPAQRLHAAAQLNVEMNQRISAVYRALDHVRDSVPELAELHTEGMQRRRETVRDGIRLVTGDDPDESTVLTLEVLLDHHSYDHVVRERGLDETAYVAWLETAMARILGIETAPDEGKAP